MMASDEYCGRSSAKKHVWLVGRWLSEADANVSFMCMPPTEGGSRDWPSAHALVCWHIEQVNCVEMCVQLTFESYCLAPCKQEKQATLIVRE